MRFAQLRPRRYAVPVSKAKMRRLWLVSALVVAVPISLVLWIIWVRRAPAYDLQKVDLRLGTLKQPFQMVSASEVSDLGETSVFMTIKDRDGKQQQFVVQKWFESEKEVQRVFVPHDKDDGFGGLIWAPEAVSDSENTKRMLVSIIGNKTNRTEFEDRILWELRRSTLDYFRIHLYRLRVEKQLNSWVVLP